MIQKIKFSQIMTIDSSLPSYFGEILTELGAIDSLTGETTLTLTNIATTTFKKLGLNSNAIDTEVSVLKDLNIYVSSYSLTGDKYLQILREFLRRAKYFKQVIIDKGFKLSLKTTRDIDKTSVGTEGRTTQEDAQNVGRSKDITSDTPQVSDIAGSEPAEFVSNIGTNDAQQDYTKHATDDKTHESTDTHVEESNLTGTKYDEARKNLEVQYLNDLVRYITRIPHEVYRAYALDSIPFPESTKTLLETVELQMELMNE